MDSNSDNLSVIDENFSNSLNSLKALSLAGMIVFHVYSPFEHFVPGFTAEVFAFLSGMLLTMGMLIKNEKDFSWKNWYKRRFVRIYPMLILVTLFIISYRYIIFQSLNYSIDSILTHMSGMQSIPGNPDFYIISGPHWFITLILTCYLLFPFFYFIIKKQYKIMVYLSISLYIAYIFISPFIYETIGNIFNTSFGEEESILRQIHLFFPKYFDFFWGMLFGYWIGKNKSKNIVNLQKSKIGLFSFVIVVIIYIIFVFFTLDLKNGDFIYYFYRNLIFFPLFSITFTLFSLYFFKNKPKINKILKIPAEESYEIILLHDVMIIQIVYVVSLIFPFLSFNIFVIFCIISVFIFTIFLAYPFYYFGNWLKSEIKYYKTIIIIISSLIVYSIISYTNLIFHLFILADLISIIIYSLTLLIIVLAVLIKNFIICSKNSQTISTDSKKNNKS